MSLKTAALSWDEIKTVHLGSGNKNFAKTQELITGKQKRRKEFQGVLVGHKVIMNLCVILLGKKPHEFLVQFDVFEGNRKNH